MAFDPHFEQHPYDIMAPWVPAAAYSKQYHRPWYSLTHHAPAPRLQNSNISLDKDKFQICLDVHQFAPNEVSVRTSEGQVVIEARHDEKEDEHGSVTRHFVRKYPLPAGHHTQDVAATLSEDGVLTVTAPVRRDSKDESERSVPIAKVGPLNGHFTAPNATEHTDDKEQDKQ